MDLTHDEIQATLAYAIKESKEVRLKTTLKRTDPMDLPGVDADHIMPSIFGSADDYMHDARIAHAQRDVIRRQQEWIRKIMDWVDAVPGEMPLPAMPGFDRDGLECDREEFAKYTV